MGINDPAPIHYLAAHLNVSKAAVYLTFIEGYSRSIFLYDGFGWKSKKFADQT